MGNMFGHVQTPTEVLHDANRALTKQARAMDREREHARHAAAAAKIHMENARDDGDKEGVRTHFADYRAAERRARDYTAQARQAQRMRDGLHATEAAVESKVVFARAASAVRQVQTRMPAAEFTQTIARYQADTNALAMETRLMRETVAEAHADLVGSGDDDVSEGAAASDDAELDAMLAQLDDADDLALLEAVTDAANARKGKATKAKATL